MEKRYFVVEMGISCNDYFSAVAEAMRFICRKLCGFDSRLNIEYEVTPENAAEAPFSDWLVSAWYIEDEPYKMVLATAHIIYR